ncbi:peptidoglycan/LPS O-acetylase OafA/YrhL [Rhizobium aquaticum]|uniref:Peptidoglycan/LPS O-acetylase OafA/YrhL n=1 Tax=Rhizobium aquaticum TaxID=1549636 RepID=A0ABV2IY69_9HYPH
MKYVPGYDGVRAIAIISVVVSHLFPNSLPGGWAGVDVFFVLSGFLITTILLDEIKTTSGIDIKSFYIKRMLRLLPAFAVMLIVMTAFLLITKSGRELYRFLGSVVISAAYLMNINRAFNLFEQGYLGHTWSLAMEEQFYLIWPAFLLWTFKRKPVAWIGGLICLVTALRVYLTIRGADVERVYNGFDTHSDGLLIGSLLVFFPNAMRMRELASCFVLIPLALLTGLLALAEQRTFFAPVFGWALSALSAAWMIYAIPKNRMLRALLSLKPLVYVGKVSYAWYLWHFPVLVLSSQFLPRSQAILLTLASFGIAALSHEFVEKPFLSLKARFKRRPGREAPV